MCMPRPEDFNKCRLWRWAAGLCFVLICVVGGFTVKDYGMSWDEPFRFKGGDSTVSYYKALFSGDTMDPLKSSYPSLFDLPLAVAHEWFPSSGTRSEKGHILSLCFGLLGLYAAWRLTARVGGERAGFWALLLLVSLPRYYGHMFFNPKDIPLAATYTVGVWALVHLFSSLPRITWSMVVCVGLAAGVALSSRIAGFLILVYFGLFAGLDLFIRYIVEGKSRKFLGKGLVLWVLRGSLAGLLAYAVLMIFWPTLHSNPFVVASESVETVQHFDWEAPVLMNGTVHLSTDLPWFYLPYWMLKTIPEHVLFLFVCSLACGGWVLLSKRSAVMLRLLPVALLLFSCVFPLFYILLSQPVLYDGMRHALFILPPFVCVAALGLEWCLRRLSVFWSKMTQCFLVFLVCLVVLTMYSLHPYQYMYFNQASGGFPAAYMQDETDYWGISHKEAAEWLNSYVDDSRVYKVHLRYSRYMLLEHIDPQRFELVPEPDGADFFVAITRFGYFDDYSEAELLHVVERQGVPLCFIFALSEEFKTKVD